MMATRVYYDPIKEIEEIIVGEHHISYGADTGGYCYSHQTFDCVLTDEEQKAVDEV